MEGLEEKLASLMQDPELMGKLSAMAQSLGAQEAAPAPAPPEMDMAMLGRLSAMARQSSIDPQQRALIQALGPYLGQDRSAKLQKAMQAARMAQMASSLLGSGGLPLLSGR